MTKFIKTILFTTVLTSSLFSDVVFDLGAQQFYYCATTITDKNGDNVPQYVEASYDVGSAIVSTGLASVDGYYRPMDYSSGHFSVQIKEPKSKWAVNFNMYADLYMEGCSVQFLSDNGQSITVHFDNDTISVAGEEKTDKYFSRGLTGAYSDISGDIQMNGDTIDITINGKNKFSIKKPNFKLAKVDISLYTEGSQYISQIDKLHSLTIATSE